MSPNEMADRAFYFLALGGNDRIFPRRGAQRSGSGAWHPAAPSLQQALALGPAPSGLGSGQPAAFGLPR